MFITKKGNKNNVNVVTPASRHILVRSQRGKTFHERHHPKNIKEILKIFPTDKLGTNASWKPQVHGEDRIIVMAPVIMPHTEAPKFLSGSAHPAADQLNFRNSVGVHNNEH